MPDDSLSHITRDSDMFVPRGTSRRLRYNFAREYIRSIAHSAVPPTDVILLSIMILKERDHIGFNRRPTNYYALADFKLKMNLIPEPRL